MGLDGVFAALGFIVAAAAIVGFPIYGWIRDKKRRGEPIKTVALLGVILLGVFGVVTVAVLVLAKSIVRGN